MEAGSNRACIEQSQGSKQAKGNMSQEEKAAKDLTPFPRSNQTAR